MNLHRLDDLSERYRLDLLFHSIVGMQLGI